MRRERTIRRLATAALVALAGFGLGACEQMADIIPDSKKPLPGERKLLFPEGVPGVSQGVPQELIRSNQQAQGQPGAPTGTQPQQAAEPPQQQAEEKPKPKPKPKVQRAARQQPAQEQQAEPAPQQQQSSPWPAPQQQPAQASPWPSAPAPGTFTR